MCKTEIEGDGHREGSWRELDRQREQGRGGRGKVLTPITSRMLASGIEKDFCLVITSGNLTSNMNADAKTNVNRGTASSSNTVI